MLRWARKLGQFQNGHYAKLGVVRVFHTTHNSLRLSIDTGNEWKLVSLLPGFNKVIYDSSENTLFEAAERMLGLWLTKTGLQVDTTDRTSEAEKFFAGVDPLTVYQTPWGEWLDHPPGQGDLDYKEGDDVQ